MDDGQHTTTPPWLDELNPRQREAVAHGDGPLLIVAGAGTGKTKTLAYRVAHLVWRGVDPGRILLLTFTRRASEEMLKRAASITARGSAVTTRVWGGTFHAVANRILRIYAKAAGLSAEFTVMDQSDAEDMINVIRQDLNLSSREKRFPRKNTCLDIYSRCVNGAAPLPDVLKKIFPWCMGWENELKSLFQHYVQRKQERQVLDYDDLLLYWSHLVADPQMADIAGGRFDHILVDEYQDTNTIQANILLGMRRTNSNITVVGDDAQSIYSFRAATVRNMLDFPKHFPGTTIVTLEQNYRSVKPILEATNRVIAQAAERFTKDLWSERESRQRPHLVTCRDEAQQDEYVIERVLQHYEEGIPLHKQAVLFRASHLSDSLEVELTRRSIPYHKYGGLRFLEAAHVKDLIAFLRIAGNPRDEMAWFRALQLIEGIGPATAASIVRHVLQAGTSPSALATFRAPPAAQDGIRRMAELLEQLAVAGERNPAGQVERIRHFYDPLLEKRYEHPAVRQRDLEHLEQIASGYESSRQFLTDLMLDPPTSTSDLAGPPSRDEDWLVLSTVHSAKGCEWDAVYLIHASDGCIPSDMSTGSREEIEEELRLMYVALTRAKDFLYVTWPLRYYHKWHAHTDRHSYAQISRFLTDAVRETFDAEDLVQADAEETPDARAGGADISAKIRSMWE